MKPTLSLAFAVALSALAVTGLHAQTSTWKIDPNHSEVNFQVRHLAVSTVRGVINGVKGTVTLNDKDLTKSSVEATMDTTTVYTGTPARDKDLKSANYFNVEANPNIAALNPDLYRAIVGGTHPLIMNQIKAVLLTVVLSAVVATIALLVAKVTVGLRASAEDESGGLDLSQHGEEGYNA